MTQQLFANNAAAKLASAISSGASSLTVQAGQGAEFPTIAGSDFFYLTLVSSTDLEIVKATVHGAASDSFTITRAQEGTSAAAFAAGDTVEMRLTKAGADNWLQHIGTVLGDLIYGSAANVLSKLAGNTTTTRKFLRQAGTGSVSAAPAWDTLTVADLPALSSSDLSGKLTDETGGGGAAVFANGPTLTNPIVGTQSPGDNSTKAASTAYVDTAVAGATGTYTDEKAQDAVGAALTDSASIDFTYNDGANTITAIVIDNSVTDGKLRDSAALSVIGRSANSTGDPADIAAGSDGDFLRRRGTTLGFGSIVENDVGASTNDAGNTSTAITIDWSVARTQKVTATGSATVTHSNMVAGLIYSLEYYTGAGSFTATFASTNFAGGTAPTLTVTASKVDVFTFYKTIGGTIFGAVYGQSFAP